MAFRSAAICCSRFLNTSTCGCLANPRLQAGALLLVRGAATAAVKTTDAKPTSKAKPWGKPGGNKKRRGPLVVHNSRKQRENSDAEKMGLGADNEGRGPRAERKWQDAADKVKREGNKEMRGPQAEHKPKRWEGENTMEKAPREKKKEARSSSQNSAAVEEFVENAEKSNRDVPSWSNVEPGETRPYHLVQRVNRMAQEGRLDEAVDMVKSASIASQNTVVWNTLIQHSFKAGKVNQAYTLFIEMKRRGFKPIPSTWAILFQGFARRVSETTEPLSELMLDRISSSYAQFTNVLMSLRDTDPREAEDYIIPFNAYLNLLLALGRSRELYDVFVNLSAYPPLRADAVTYAIVLRCILQRPDQAWPGEPNEAKPVRDAILAMKVWEMMRAEEKDGIFVPVDSHLFSAMLRILTASPRVADHQHGLELIEKYLGLIKPGALSPSEPAEAQEAKSTKKEQPLALSSHSFHVALLHVVAMRRFRFVLHYVQQVQDSPWASRVLTVDHMNLAINAHAELAIAKGSTDVQEAFDTIQWMIRQNKQNPKAWSAIVPNEQTYTAMLRACWKGRNDYTYVRRTLNLMTGYDMRDFDQNDAEIKPPKAVQGRTFMPGPLAMACILRASLNSPHHIWHAFRFMREVGVDQVFGGDTKSDRQSRGDRRKLAFYRVQLADAVLEAQSVAGRTLMHDVGFYKEARKRSREAKAEFESKWKAGPALKEWMGESLDHNAVDKIVPIEGLVEEAEKQPKRKGIRARLDGA